MPVTARRSFVTFSLVRFGDLATYICIRIHGMTTCRRWENTRCRRLIYNNPCTLNERRRDIECTSCRFANYPSSFASKNGNYFRLYRWSNQRRLNSPFSKVLKKAFGNLVSKFLKHSVPCVFRGDFLGSFIHFCQQVLNATDISGFGASITIQKFS